MRPVNVHDSVILPETLANLIAFTQRLGLDLEGSTLTLDSGFDSAGNKAVIKGHGLIPAIYPNRRNTKAPIAVARLLRWFNRQAYQERYKVERTFGWQDTYRRLAMSYDRLTETRKGFRYLAYAMINFRITFNLS